MKSKGFTLIELAVVLAIIAVLAAILTPMVTGYIDQARVARATADAKTVSQAVTLYRRDTGVYPIFSSLANSRTGTTNASALVGPGTEPTLTGTSYTAAWTTILTTTTLAVTQLNTALTGLTVNDTNPAHVSYRGPYIGALDTDPWGNYYVVTANNLASSTNRAFVVSAGPNGILETNPAQGTTTFTTSGDDIAVPIN